MDNLPSPPPDRGRRLSADELIAIFVALLGLGGIFFWGINQKNIDAISWLNNFAGLNIQGNKQSPINLGSGVIAPGSIDGQANPDSIRPSKINIGEPKVEVPKTDINVTLPSPPSLPKPPIVPVPLPTVAVDIPKPSVTPNIQISPSLQAEVPDFKDLPESFWGRPYILELHKRGILNDFGDGKFEPNKPVTRAEFAGMLSKAFNKPTNISVPKFTDLGNLSAEKRAAIDKSVQMGFMSGYSPDKFAPNQGIPRHQLQIALIKGLNLSPSGDVEQILGKFPDAGEMPKYAREKMSAAVESNVLVQDQDGSKLQPLKVTSRAEAASLIYQSLIKDGQIKKN